VTRRESVAGNGLEYHTGPELREQLGGGRGGRTADWLLAVGAHEVIASRSGHCIDDERDRLGQYPDVVAVAAGGPKSDKRKGA
jgi:hypothetical protein